MDLAPDFDEFCALLTARAVEFVIVGAHALAFHGAPRFTVWATREIGQFGSGRAAFIGREAFLRNKRAAARPKDLADIDALREPEDSS